MSLIKGIKEKYGDLFKKYFSTDIDNFLNYGFDLESFVVYVGVPDDDIPYDWVKEHYGKEASDLINDILDYENNNLPDIIYDLYEEDKNEDDYNEISNLLDGEDSKLIDTVSALFTIAKNKMKNEDIN